MARLNGWHRRNGKATKEVEFTFTGAGANASGPTWPGDISLHLRTSADYLDRNARKCTIRMNAEEARRVGAWLTHYADWLDRHEQPKAVARG